MAEKENRRVMMSKRMMKDALIEMLKEKDIYHISIRELCERANVNRTTFYKYYGSQFDLLADMENDMISHANQAVREHADEEGKIVLNICHYLEDNLELARLLINNNVDPTFPERLFSQTTIREKVIDALGAKYDENKLEYIYNYSTYGSYQVLRVWLNKEDREPPEEIAEILLMNHFRK